MADRLAYFAIQMQLLHDIINDILPVPEPSLDRLVSQFYALTRPKGDLLHRPDKPESNLFFLSKGLARAYSIHNGQEITFWFGTEGAPLLSMKNYVSDLPSYEYVELLEECELYGIGVKVLRKLFETDIHIANWGRAFAEQELLKTEERLISRQFRSAETRYLELLNSFPELIQRVQLRHIASYLGITPVSLSRIRANIS